MLTQKEVDEWDQPGGFVPPQEDSQRGPAHYTVYEIEPITFIMANQLAFWEGNVIKYVMRAGAKVPKGMTAAGAEIQDLEKAKHYIDFRIQQIRSIMPTVKQECQR